MSTSQLPRLLNSAYDESFAFPQFARLPWELRNQIWVSALQTRRLVRAELMRPDLDSPLEEEDAQEIIRCGSVYLAVSGFQLLPVLLRVNSESRLAAFDFYRMRLPCLLYQPRKKRAKLTPGILFFNPEHDILWINNAFHEEEAFGQILQAIIKHDTLGVGLRSIAICASEGSHLSLTNRNGTGYVAFESPLGPPHSQTTKNIRELYLVQEVDSYRVRAVREQYNNQGGQSGASMVPEPHHHRKPLLQAYTPIAREIPSFSLLPHDPRPITDDLTRLYINDWAPQVNILAAWENTFFSTPDPDDVLPLGWGLDSSRVTARVLIMCRDENPVLPPSDSLYDAPSLQRSRLSSSEPRIHKSESPFIPSISLIKDEETRKQETCVAVGFWLFPFKAFAPSNKVIVRPGGVLALWDVSDSPPELGLFHLPADTT
ncbi:hypothetical protein GGR57DRAFT_480514 [Xylariaceae sp. FL1272]|nr:hypothetical protein GGR57DRAFT_480514 [Xylariaceae sp. FL1272]